jgi:hypothetical protein
VISDSDENVEVTCGAGGTTPGIDNLPAGGTAFCTATGTATEGQYDNLGTATAEEGASDSDPSHYLGIEPTP